jgi:hypothetical protein
MYLFVAFLSPESFAQQKGQTLQGYLGVEGGESYTYRLVFTDSSGYIKGFAYTWLYEQKQVKATITGRIDRANKVLSFKETSIVSNSGFESNTTICLIQAELKYKRDNDNMVFAGAITSSDISNVYCGQGTITFQDNETLRALWTGQAMEPAAQRPFIKGDRSKKPIIVVYDTASKKPQRPQPASVDRSTEERIRSGEEKVLHWDTDTMIIKIWDGGEIDGDVISLKVNGVSYLSKLTLAKEPKRVIVPVAGAEIEITVTANNEGNTPPNTANLTLSDGVKEYPFVVYNTIGRQATIKAKKKQKQK